MPMLEQNLFSQHVKCRFKTLRTIRTRPVRKIPSFHFTLLQNHRTSAGGTAKRPFRMLRQVACSDKTPQRAHSKWDGQTGFHRARAQSRSGYYNNTTGVHRVRTWFQPCHPGRVPISTGGNSFDFGLFASVNFSPRMRLTTSLTWTTMTCAEKHAHHLSRRIEGRRLTCNGSADGSCGDGEDFRDYMRILGTNLRRCAGNDSGHSVAREIAWHITHAHLDALSSHPFCSPY